MIALRPKNGTDGIRGFIAKDAIKRYVSDAKLEQGDTCESSRGLAIGGKAAIARSGLDGGLPCNGPYYYLGKSSQSRCDSNALDCGASFETYEPTNFPDNIIMSLSSTGVSGGADAERAGGGIAMAIIAEGDQFGRRDRIGYRDPNVPYEAFPCVRWCFGSANLGKGKTRINASPKRKIGSPECPIDTKPP